MNLENIPYREREQYGDWRTIEIKDYNGNLKGEEIDVRSLSKSMNHAHFAQLLENFCNSYSTEFNNGKRVGRMLHTSHRTLQATVVRFLLGIVVGIGEQTLAYTDARNEQAVKCAKQIDDMIDNGSLNIGYMI